MTNNKNRMTMFAHVLGMEMRSRLRPCKQLMKKLFSSSSINPTQRLQSRSTSAFHQTRKDNQEILIIQHARFDLLKFQLKTQTHQICIAILKNVIQINILKPPGGASSSVSSGQRTIAASLEKTRMLSSKSREYKELTNAVTYCLAKDLLPIYSVEEGFKTMLKSFNPKYQLPSRHYFTRVAIPTLYTTTKEMVEHTIKTDMVYFASTTDLWSSAAMQPYISYSIHFIDKVWQLKTYCLHTRETIKQYLSETLHQWNLDPLKQQIVLQTSN